MYSTYRRNKLAAHVAMTAAIATAWLRASRSGHCGATDSNRGDCVSGNFGNLGLSAFEASNWTMAVSACLARCATCARCRHISVSLQHRDCSWYAQCETTHTDVFCFRSGSVVEPDAIARVSRPPPWIIDDFAAEANSGGAAGSTAPPIPWDQAAIDPRSIAIVQASDRPPPLPLNAVIESDGAGGLRPVAGLGGKGIRSLTAALNRAYASLHGHAYIYARIVGGCGRGLSAWCQLPAVLGLLRERVGGGAGAGASGGGASGATSGASGGGAKSPHLWRWVIAMDEDVAFNTRCVTMDRTRDISEPLLLLLLLTSRHRSLV